MATGGGAVPPAGAIARFTASAWEPASAAAPGLTRREAIIDHWVEHLRADVAFELHALASGGSVAARITGNPVGLDRTRRAMRRAIGLS